MGDSRGEKESEQMSRERTDAKEVLHSTGQFNHNHSGWIIKVKQENINSGRETNGTNFKGVFNPVQ